MLNKRIYAIRLDFWNDSNIILIKSDKNNKTGEKKIVLIYWSTEHDSLCDLFCFIIGLMFHFLFCFKRLRSIVEAVRTIII